MFGRQARLPVDIRYELPKQEQTAAAMQQEYEMLYTRLTAELVVECQGSYKDIRAVLLKVHGEPYEPNKFVWLHTTTM